MIWYSFTMLIISRFIALCNSKIREKPMVQAQNKPKFTANQSNFIDILQEPLTKYSGVKWLRIAADNRAEHKTVPVIASDFAENGSFGYPYNQISISTFKTPKSGKISDIIDINVIPIDIDFYKSEFWSKTDPMTMACMILDELDYYKPTYIEIGRGIKFVYVLSEPIHLQNTKSLVNAFYRVQRYIIKKIETMYFNPIPCDMMKPTSFIRVPDTYHKGKRIQVCDIGLGDTYTIQELLSAMPEQKAPRKYVKHKSDTVFSAKADKVLQMHNQYTLAKEICEKLELEAENQHFNREHYLHIYANFLLLQDETDVLDRVFALNKRFPSSLRQNIVRNKIQAQIRQKKVYKYKFETINQMIGREIFMTKREKLKREKIANGTTREQIAEKNYQKVIEYYKKGLKQVEICELTKLTKGRVSQMVKQYKAESLENKL